MFAYFSEILVLNTLCPQRGLELPTLQVRGALHCRPGPLTPSPDDESCVPRSTSTGCADIWLPTALPPWGCLGHCCATRPGLRLASGFLPRALLSLVHLHVPLPPATSMCSTADTSQASFPNWSRRRAEAPESSHPVLRSLHCTLCSPLSCTDPRDHLIIEVVSMRL